MRKQQLFCDKLHDKHHDRLERSKRGGNLPRGDGWGDPCGHAGRGRRDQLSEVMRNFALYNGLVSLDANCKTISMDLAEEMIPSPDARTWTIRLRPGVTFHNGKPLTAEDVVYTFSRIINPKAPHNGAAALPTSPGQMKVLDAHTARVTFDIPYATFLEQISAQITTLASSQSAMTRRRRSGRAPSSSRASLPVCRASS